MTTSRHIIATRRLSYSRKGESDRRDVEVGITAPYLLTKESMTFAFDEGTAGCAITFDGLPQEDIFVYGADRIQALAFAVDIDPYLRGLSARYDFYFESGEPYFDA